MRVLPTVALAVVIALSSCAGPTATTSGPEASTSRPIAATARPNATTTSTAVPTTLAHVPIWITVKYRSDAVDVANPWFVRLGRSDSSLVDAAFYDAGNQYAIIVLNGTPYHYCGMSPAEWSAFTSAGSLGRYLNSRIKGNFDCRTGFIPEY
jgi:hypothetical protein